MFGIGSSELLILILLSSGGLGRPIGVPPLPADPLMSRAAPANCLFYTTWAGVGEVDPASSNFTEKLLAEPEMKKYYAELSKKVEDILKQATANQPEANAELATAVLQSIKVATLNPGMAYLSDLKINPGKAPTINGGFLFNLGDGVAEFQKLFDRVKAQDQHGKISLIDIGGAKFFRTQSADESQSFIWGVRGKFVVGGIGEGEVEKIMARARGEVPEWLVKVQERLKLARVSNLTYFNPKQVLAIVQQITAAEQGPEQAAQFTKGVQAFGLDAIDGFASVSGMDAKGCVSRTWIGVNGTPTGILSWLDMQPLVANDLQKIPVNSPVGVAFKLDIEKSIAKVLAMVKEVDPMAAEKMTEGLGGVGAQLGFNLRKDVLESLGDTWRIYANPDAGGLLTGWTISAPVTNSQKLTPVFQQLMQFAEVLAGGDPQPGKPTLKKTTAGAVTIYSVSLPVPGVPVAPAWCLTEKELLIGATPAAIQAALQEGDVAKSLATQPELQPYINSKSRSFAVAYLDARQLSETFTPLIQMAMKQAGGGAGPGGPFPGNPFGDLPQVPTAAIEKHLQPTVAALRRTPDGVEFDMHQTMPTGNIGVVAPVAVAMLLPAIQAARGAAERTSSSNNLKQIGIAIHNYHDVYNFLPPAFSVDTNNKPLLSWRVHILPFVEQNELYEKFHLNEPWDSEHNKKLIAEMPKVFRAPNSKAVPGKTNYLGVRGKQGVFVPPQGPMRGGITFADVTDGTSNTIAVVEANDESAVIWTKPDDFTPDAKEPTKGLIGLFPNGFQALMLDGAVRMIRADADKKALNYLFMRDDGEPVSVDKQSVMAEQIPVLNENTDPLAQTPAAKAARGMNNLKQIALALHNDYDTHISLPPSYSVNDKGKPLLSWRVHILPYIEANELYEKFKLDEPWDSEHNKKLIDEMPKLFRSPNSQAAAGMTHYLGVRGKNNAFVPATGTLGPPSRGLKFESFTDGMSNTLGVVEVSDESAVIWTKPDDFEPDEKDPIKGLLGLQPDGFQAMFMDGAVRLIPAKVKKETLKALFTRNGGEVVNTSAL